MPTTSNRQASIDSRRITLEREIAIRVPRFDTFVTEYSSNISTTGMFIVSDKPQAPGTTFTFEFSVADDWKLIRGKAQVVWTRYRDEGGERPAGMGVRFVELDAQSRRLIRWIVEKHIREGGKPFELDELRNVIDEALEDVIETDEAISSAAASPATIVPARPRPQARRPVASQARSSQRNIFPLVATAAAIVLGLVFLFWLTEWLPNAQSAETDTLTEAEGTGAEAPSPQAGDDGDARSAGASPTASTSLTEGLGSGDGNDPKAVPNAEGEPTAAVGASAPPVGSAYAGVRGALSDWASAWSAQDVDGYLSAYSQKYRPAGASRAAWAAVRRERLTSPDFIKVSISQLEITRVRDDIIRASFSQSYRSDRFSDTVRKEVEMVWESGAWKILREVVR